MSLRSPLAQVRGLGAAGGGAQHWIGQRVSAVALIPLTIWFVLSLLGLPEIDFLTLRGWIASGWAPVLLSLLLLVLCYHSWLGVQVVIEDYVTRAGKKICALLASTFLHGLIAAAGLYAVLRIALVPL